MHEGDHYEQTVQALRNVVWALEQGGAKPADVVRTRIFVTDIARWAEVIRDRAAGCREVYVYFKHEEAGKGPQFARLLMDALGLP